MTHVWAVPTIGYNILNTNLASFAEFWPAVGLYKLLFKESPNIIDMFTPMTLYSVKLLAIDIMFSNRIWQIWLMYITALGVEIILKTLIPNTVDFSDRDFLIRCLYKCSYWRY